MTGMPDRIWADWIETFGSVEIGTWADTVRFSKQKHEYIRADVATAMVAAEREAMQDRLAAAEAMASRKWHGMDIAPKGSITESVGCRGVSEWFLGRVAPEFKDSRPPFIVIRRRAWPQGDSWECAGETYYVPRFFDAWAEIFPDTQGDQ